MYYFSIRLELGQYKIKLFMEHGFRNKSFLGIKSGVCQLSQMNTQSKRSRMWPVEQPNEGGSKIVLKDFCFLIPNGDSHRSPSQVQAAHKLHMLFLEELKTKLTE